MQSRTQLVESRAPTAGAPERHDRTGAGSLMRGGTQLALAMLAANAGNYALNLLLGRWLTPSEFADANLMVTLMLLVATVAAPLQMVTVRAVTMREASGRSGRGEEAAAWIYRRARVAGVVLGLLFVLPAFAWQRLFHTASPWTIVILGAALPAYLRQAVRRGVLQGRLQFGRLAVTYVIEAVARVAAASALVVAGFGSIGATAGLALSFWVTSGAVRWMQPLPAHGALDRGDRIDLRRFVAPTMVLLAGQLIINNVDVLVVKASFPGAAAGVYGAVALIGRAVFFVSWSTVATLFPAITRREAQAEGSHRLLLGGVAVITLLCGSMVGAAALGGERFLVAAMGPQMAGTQRLLVSYALATMVFAVTNLLATYQLSRGRRREIRLLFAMAVAQAGLVIARRHSLRDVVDVQVLAMSVLLVAVVASMAIEARRARGDRPGPGPDDRPGAGAERIDGTT